MQDKVLVLRFREISSRKWVPDARVVAACSFFGILKWHMRRNFFGRAVCIKGIETDA